MFTCRSSTAEAVEHNFRATMEHETESRNRARHVSWASDGEACEDATAAARRVQTPQYVTTDQFIALTDQVKTLLHTVDGLQLQVERLQTTYEERQWTGMIPPWPPHFQVKPRRMCFQSPNPTRESVGPCFNRGGLRHLRKIA